MILEIRNCAEKAYLTHTELRTSRVHPAWKIETYLKNIYYRISHVNNDYGSKQKYCPNVYPINN